MVLYLSEAEVLERYIEGLKKSASRAGEFVTAEAKNKPRILVEFIAGIKTAAGSAHALAHYQQNPKWLDVRDILEGIISVGEHIPVYEDATNPIWLRIKTNLESILETGKKMATSKAMTKADVLTHVTDKLENLCLIQD